MGMKARRADMAKWGRKHYGITEPDDKKAIRLLTVILMGKQEAGAFKPVTLRANKKLKSAPVTVELPDNLTVRRKSPCNPRRADSFYDSWAWKTLRYKVLKRHGARCMLCGRTAADGVKICVDHIKPRAFFPELELEESNLQVLCNDCNMGKGRWDDTDFRV